MKQTTLALATTLALTAVSGTALAEIGLWDQVKAAIAADPDIQEEWELAVEIRRTDPLVQMMIDAIGLTPEQVDAILIRANELVA